MLIVSFDGTICVVLQHVGIIPIMLPSHRFRGTCQGCSASIIPSSSCLPRRA